MQTITKEIASSLINNQASPAVTMYIPTHVAATPPHMTEDQIRFKNLFHQAAEQLKAQGHLSFSKSLQKKLDELLADNEFWLHQSKGVLVCATEHEMRMFRLPIDTEEYVAVDESFYLAPVLGLLYEDQSFYVLTVAQHKPQLFSGDMYGLRSSGIELPETVEAALNIDEPNQKSENQGSATGPSTSTGWFNGRGGARDPHEEDRMRFFRMIDSMVFNAVDRSLPIILAGVDTEVAEYRSISKYPHLLSRSIAGSYSGAHPQDLYEQAKDIISEEIISAKQQEMIEEYNRLSGANPGRVAHEKQAIERAAEEGRIDKLLVRLSRHTTDTVRDDAKAVDRITFPEPQLRKTINKLAMKVWQMSGSVINLTADKIPHGAPMVARLRY